jgi:hypothetical protein
MDVRDGSALNGSKLLLSQWARLHKSPFKFAMATLNPVFQVTDGISYYKSRWESVQFHEKRDVIAALRIMSKTAVVATRILALLA